MRFKLAVNKNRRLLTRHQIYNLAQLRVALARPVSQTPHFTDQIISESSLINATLNIMFLLTQHKRCH